MSMTGMLQRCWAHDYCAPFFYMITVVTEPRRECLSQLHTGAGAVPETKPGAVSATKPGANSATLIHSPIGEVVLDVWQRTSDVYKKVEACECVIMPDHFHGILRIKERLSRPMGHIVKAFKRISEDDCRSKGLLGSVLGAAQSGSVLGAAPAPKLWQKGFQDSILLRKGQLKAMANYIADNPHRLAAKRANPELFTVVTQQSLTAEHKCAMIGNRFLLTHPLKQEIQISRSISPSELAAEKEKLLYAAEHGTVLVSPCISPGEKEIARAVMDAGKPLIVLLANGFSPYYKPPGRYFEACANGHLLMLTPFPYQRRKQTITRKQCLFLNELAHLLATQSRHS